MLIQTKELSIKHHSHSPLLSFPDLTITPHDRILLLGESGSGKTTLLSSLAGFLKPTSGQVFVDNKDIYELSTKSRDALRGKTFGFVFQTLHLIPSLTLSQNIMLAADMSGMPCSIDRLNHLLSSLGLHDKAHHKPSSLSQGEQQRAALARAVFNSPTVIIADEPTSSLDDKNADNVMNILEEQAKESNCALLVATHDYRIKHRFQNIISLQLTHTQQATS